MILFPSLRGTAVSESERERRSNPSHDLRKTTLKRLVRPLFVSSRVIGSQHLHSPAPTNRGGVRQAQV